MEWVPVESCAVTLIPVNEENVKNRIKIGRNNAELLILLAIGKKSYLFFEFGCKCRQFLVKNNKSKASFLAFSLQPGALWFN
jgi:hypothetical protein